jgi:hypothetical protein
VMVSSMSDSVLWELLVPCGFDVPDITRPSVSGSTSSVRTGLVERVTAPPQGARCCGAAITRRPAD